MMNKRGFPGAGFGVLAVIILLLFSGTILLAIVRQQASKVDESLQVGLCRLSNEIKFGLKEKTSGFVSGPQICSTIDKTSKKSQVPASKYPQTKKGAELEIREMIKSCWHMWLDGSRGNVFEEYSFTDGCFTCYAFKIEEGINGVTFSSLSKSMSEPFFVEDKTDKCAPGGGGKWKPECDKDEKSIITRGKEPSKCCIKGLKSISLTSFSPGGTNKILPPLAPNSRI